MTKPVKNLRPVIPARLAFLFAFTVFYWGFHFIFRKTSFQMSQVVFDLFAGVLSGAVTHVLMAKLLGPLLFGRSFCGWVCWNAFVFDIVPVKKKKVQINQLYFRFKYVTLAIVLILPFILLLMGYGFTSRYGQLRWLLTENAVIYLLGIWLSVWLGDRRAFCKYLCPAGALMTLTSTKSVIKVEKNHIRCSKCRKCEEACPMGVPVLDYISTGQRVSHPECILCAECVNQCPRRCLTVGIGKKSQTTPELSRSF